MKKNFLRDLQAMKEELLFVKTDPSRILDVHTSALPYCPTSFLLQFNPDLLQKQKFVSQSIMNEGTALHTNMDLFLGRTARAFGDFVCRNCGCVQHLRQASEFKDFLCPECGHELEYQEVYINYKGFVGHVDFIYNNGTLKKPEYWIVDFKSKTLNYVNAKKQEIPINYHYQTLAYTLLLHNQYRLKINAPPIAIQIYERPTKRLSPHRRPHCHPKVQK